jgi:hypothetical protein
MERAPGAEAPMMRLTRDKRPPIEQVKSGLRIVGAMFASVITVSLFRLAYVQIEDADHAHDPFEGWFILIALTVAVGLTSQYWRRWFFFIPGYLGMRFGIWLLFGWFSKSGFIFIGFPVLMFAMSAMSFRFSESPKLRAFDRLVLLITAACLLAAMLELFSEGQNAMALLFAAIGDSILFVYRIYPARKARQRTSHDSAPLTINR